MGFEFFKAANINAAEKTFRIETKPSPIEMLDRDLVSLTNALDEAGVKLE